MKKIIGFSILISILGCTQNGFKAKGGAFSFGSAAGTVELLPSTDKLDSTCMTNDAYDACLFNKNPVFHLGRPLDSQSTGNLDSIQTLGVKLTSLSTSGYLENASFKVTSLKMPRLNTQNKSALKILISQAQSEQIDQLMTYYYGTRTVEYLSTRGPLAILNQNINIIVDDQVSGWRRPDKSIHLSKLQGQLGSALDASQVIYLLGIANADLAIQPATDNLHRLCNQDPKGCCVSQNGCSRAIAAGAGVYFVAMMFPQAPVVGELSANRLSGVRLCSASDRDLRTVKDISAAAIFTTCAARNGDVNILGDLYASIWWEIRQKSSSYEKVDRLFLEHLSRLSQADSFATAKSKILQLDSTINGGQLSQIISDEFARRGL